MLRLQLPSVPLPQPEVGAIFEGLGGHQRLSIRRVGTYATPEESSVL